MIDVPFENWDEHFEKREIELEEKVEDILEEIDYLDIDDLSKEELGRLVKKIFLVP